MELEDVVIKHSIDLDSLSDKLIEVTKSIVLLMERERNMSGKELEISTKIDKLTEKINEQSKILTKVESRISELESRTSLSAKIAEVANKYWRIWIVVIASSGFIYQITMDDFAKDILKQYQIQKSHAKYHKHNKDEEIRIEREVQEE